MKLSKHEILTTLKDRQELAAFLVICAALIMVSLLIISFSGNKFGNPTAQDEINQYYGEQVDDSNGAPRDGRDPASQQQSSLASAASNPTGAGQRIDKPATGVGEDHSNHHDASKSSGNGIGTNGCYVDYGIQGEQCVPVHAATNGVLTCDGVRTHGGFPNGVKVVGVDRFQLDTNHDGVACGASD